MAQATRHLGVVKADGQLEEYLHTKVIGTINNALAAVGQSDITVAEHLAEVVTYYLHKQRRRRIPSREIFSVIKTVLAATGYEQAAVALTEHQHLRRMKRGRVEVVDLDIRRLSDAERLHHAEPSGQRSPWEKSRIVADLMEKHGLSRQTSRAIASMVEEKIFNMDMTCVPTGLIKQLVLGDAAMMLAAEKQLQTT